MKVILAGYSSELINLMKKCNFNISGVVEPNEKIKIVNYNVFLSDNDAIKTIVPDGVVIGIDDIDRKKNVHSISKSMDLVERSNSLEKCPAVSSCVLLLEECTKHLPTSDALL